MFDGPNTFTHKEFLFIMAMIAIPSVLFLGIGLWLKISGMRQHAKAKKEEEAKKSNLPT